MRSLTLTELRSVPYEVRSGLGAALAVNRPLAVFGLASALTLVGTLAGMLLDPRIITGAAAWLKPAKFAISFTFYSFTFLWLLSFVRGHPRLVRLAATATAVTGVVELAIIVAQAARGTTSHFNEATPLDGILFGIMGGAVVVLWLMNLLTTILLIRQRLPDSAFAWGLRLGLAISVVGLAEGFLMLQPGQNVVAALGGAHAVAGAHHSVGVADGGPGLPLVGWSTEGGDLRAAHFVGMHALQALPLAGWLLSRHWAQRRLSALHRRAIVWAVGFAYLNFVIILAWQALRAQSLVAPDGVTLSALALLAGATAAAAGGIILHAGTRRTTAGAQVMQAM